MRFKGDQPTKVIVEGTGTQAEFDAWVLTPAAANCAAFSTFYCSDTKVDYFYDGTSWTAL